MKYTNREIELYEHLIDLKLYFEKIEGQMYDEIFGGTHPEKSVKKTDIFIYITRIRKLFSKIKIPNKVIIAKDLEK